jgi:N-acyl-phosphatidylethanolamine-hydrolysing phospholipase D
MTVSTGGIDRAPFDVRRRRFRNPPGSPLLNRDRRAWLRFFRRRARDARRAPNDIPNGLVLGLDAALAGYHALDGENTVTWLGHAAFLLRIAGRTILLDPFLSDWASPRPNIGPRRYTPPGIPVQHLPPIDLLLVSHNHYDHLDAPTIEALAPKHRIAVGVPLGVGRFFARRGYSKVRELDWSDQLAIDGVTVTALPALHNSKRGPFDQNKTLWASFAIEGDGRRVYFSGDTAYGPVFADVGEAAGPFDLGMVGIGAYAPRELMRANHTTPEEAVRLGRDLGVGTLLGMHWGSVILTDEPPFEPPERFMRAGCEAGYAEDALWLMRIGETRVIPKRAGN